MSWAAALLVAMTHVVTASQLRELGTGDDARVVPGLERLVYHLLEQRDRFPDGMTPPAIEEELAASLEALERLAPSEAIGPARAVLARTPCQRACWAARRIVSRRGEVGLIRQGLDDYFAAPDAWHRVLASAARATGDVRLRDFAPELASADAAHVAPRAPVSERLRRSRIALAAGVDASDVLHLEARPDTLRGLIERDASSLAHVLIEPQQLAGLYPYLAWSRHRAVRERLFEASAARAPALRALLLSPAPTAGDKTRYAESMEDAWAEAIAAGAYEALKEALGEPALVAFIHRTESPAALSRIPLPEARERLISLGTPASIDALSIRPDRVLAMGAARALLQSPDRELRASATALWLRLGAPGSSALLNDLALADELPRFLGAVIEAPVSPTLTARALRKAAERVGSSPEAVAAMTHFHRLDPVAFLDWLDPRVSSALRERAQFVMSLSGDPSRLPLLIELAVLGGGSPVSREAGFRGLAEQDLGRFDKRLHRLAGDSDRSIRYQTSLALTPTGEGFALRLLLAELDETDARAALRARLAIERLAPGRARAILESMVLDQTITSFGTRRYLELGPAPEEVRELIWSRLEPLVSALEPGALELAARLGHPKAVAAVERYLR